MYLFLSVYAFSLCSSSSSGTCYVDQDDLVQRSACFCLSRAEIKCMCMPPCLVYKIFLIMYMCLHVLEEARDARSTRARVTGRCKSPVLMLRTKPGSSILKQCALFPAEHLSSLSL